MSNFDCGSSGRTVILSAIVGAIAGAAAVLLLAPKVRRESAQRIREISHDLEGRASATIDTAKDRVSSTVARSRDFLDEKGSVISAAVEAGKEAYARRKTRPPSDG
jgi:gas vesicle protein